MHFVCILGFAMAGNSKFLPPEPKSNKDLLQIALPSALLLHIPVLAAVLFDGYTLIIRKLDPTEFLVCLKFIAFPKHLNGRK